MGLPKQAGGICKERAGAAGVFDGRRNCGGIATQVDGDECADEGQTALLELAGEETRVCGHEAPVTQFGACVARRDQFVEHLRVCDAGTAEICELERAPRTRGIGNGSRWHGKLLRL